MTIKEQLHRVVDDLDDERAADVLAFALRASSRVVEAGNGAGRVQEEPGVDVDRESLWTHARPIAVDDPLWGIVGLVDDGPADMSSEKHRYLAERYGDLHDK